MGGGIGHLVLSGPLILAVPVAAAAGAVTFLSPCVLPLVPGYLSYVAGMSGVDAQASRAAGDGPAGTGSTAAADSTAAAGVARPRRVAPRRLARSRQIARLRRAARRRGPAAVAAERR